MHLLDPQTVGVLYVIKAVRFAFLWIALYVADKVYQARYVTSVFIESRPPPPLVGVIVTALVIEAVVSALFVGSVLVLLKVQNKAPLNSYAIDGGLLALAVVDYALTTSCLLALGACLASVAGDRRRFRYGEDGLRGVRATSLACLGLAAIVVLSMPTFMLA